MSPLVASSNRCTAQILRSTLTCGAMGEFQIGDLVIRGEELRFLASDLIPLRAGCEAVVSGYRERHPMYGEQFQVRDVHSVSLPRSTAGVADFLTAHLGGAGPARAKRIANLGANALDTLASDPDVLLRLFPGKVGRTLRFSWDKLHGMWQADQRAIDVASRLHGAGLSVREVRLLMAYFRSPEVAEILLLRRPYRLLDVPGMNWKRADAIAGKIGVSPDDPERGQAACVVVLERAMADGHSAQTEADVVAAAGRLLGSKGRADAALESAEFNGAVVEDGGLLYLPSVLQMEWFVGRQLHGRAAPVPKLSNMVPTVVASQADAAGLNTEQTAAVRMSLTHYASILTGGPGTGKTTTLRSVVEANVALGHQVRIAAPTGRAAARATELTGAPAETVHRLIGGPPGAATAQPIPADLLIVDEASMLSLDMIEWLLRNTRMTTRILFVGDADQLPSVGHGAVLRDLLKARLLPHTELVRVYRQPGESGIVDAARAVLQGDEPESAPDFQWHDLGGAAQRGEEEARAALRDAVVGVANRKVTQVLTPVRRGLLGVKALNQYLQHLLNPDGEMGPRLGDGLQARVGDRVIQVRNDYTLGSHGVMNGEMGFVREAGAGRVVVDFSERSTEISGLKLWNLNLAWATTVHKSQGSEFERIVFVANDGAGPLLSRQLLYTAITRARRDVVMIAPRSAVQAALHRDARDHRTTGLVRHLKELV